tara:strand:- start:17806 stop:17931 length:126 start_codon:yes stop_codon:yes gene_type:complete
VLVFNKNIRARKLRKALVDSGRVKLIQKTVIIVEENDDENA